MAFLHFIILMAALGQRQCYERRLSWHRLMFILIGNYSGKFAAIFAGSENAWTLSSELSWHKTHRLAGRLFILLGAIIGLSG
jgi:uncharacterized membrane protein